MKKFSIPVTWEVWDKVEVEAETIEDAIQYVKEHIDEIPLGTEPEYIDGSYRIDDGENGEANLEETIRYLKKYWNLSGGIDGEDCEEHKNMPLEVVNYFKKYGHIPQTNEHVEIIALCNEEKHYKPGDTGTIECLDDAGQIHVQWDHGGSIALLPMEDDFKLTCLNGKEFIYRKEGC